jgi:endonuclease III
MAHATRGSVCRRVIERYGGRFSTELGIRPAPGRPREIFRWFLAAILLAAPIRTETALSTCRVFDAAGLDRPQRILAAGWDTLVALLDEGGYTRYDFRTATKLQAVCALLTERYHGSLPRLYRAASSAADLEARLRALGKGIGPVTINIFLREMRGTWKKADPPPSPLAVDAAHHLGFVPPHVTAPRAVARTLRRVWTTHRVRGRRYADFESALVRAGLALHRARPAAAGPRGQRLAARRKAASADSPRTVKR